MTINKEKIKAVAFDLDGTLYIGEKLIDGVKETIDSLNNSGIKIFYFTNNSAKSRDAIYQKLFALGLSPRAGTIYNSAYAAAMYLKENKYRSVYCFGANGLKDEIVNAGLNCVPAENGSPQAVVVGLDHDFNYDKLGTALNLLKNKNCKFIICNRDRTYPVEGNLLMPGCGPIVAALEYATERTADVIIGKPNTYMLELLCRDWKLVNHEILVVGDTYESDIAMANNFGSPSVLIDPSGKKIDGTVTITKILNLIKYIDA
ncbi:MAG: HAD-IIA family hydrolase [Deltaproteobacteria bacterium]|nr:HAD-IIA family hydrolase [Deltaproteobacteria bacterium]